MVKAGAGEVEKLARHLCRSLYQATDGRPNSWRMLGGISSTAGTDQAVDYAVGKGWLLFEGGHSVCLTDAGREISKPT